jgi:uncharacterized integral membrane protein
MRIKTIIVLVIAVLLTVIIMQNTQSVLWTVLFANFYASKIVMLLGMSVVAFFLGVLVGRPSRRKFPKNPSDDIDSTDPKPNTQSDEDRDYIS